MTETAEEISTDSSSENSGKRIHVSLPVWNGPLDLLLDLIRGNEVNIYDIPIAEITHQYLETIRMMQKLDIEVASEFLAMAATLIYIKSRMMLPAEMEGDGDDEFFRDPRSNLVLQLLEYQKFKKLAGLLEDREFHVQRLVERRDNQITFELPTGEDDAWKEVTLFELIKVFSGLVDVMDVEEFGVLRDEDVRIEDRMNTILEQLAAAGKVNFHELFEKGATKQMIIVTFWAILELYKLSRITIKQHAVFGDIFLFPRVVEPSAEASHDRTEDT